MGACVSHLKKEMVSPPARSGNWEGLAPQRLEAHAPREKSHKLQSQSHAGNGSALERRETPSGISGLTYDHAGRPV